MLAMHCTEISALEKILGLYYSHFQIPLLVFMHPYELLLPKNCYFSMRVEKSRLTTDEQGRVTVPPPWSGRYVLEVTHFEAKPGGSENDKFDRTRHITSLSFVQRNGQAWSDKR